MISNDERREVAARLRVLASHKAADEELVHDTLGLYRGENIEGYDTYGVMHLADLIEPEPERTCKIDGTYDDEFGIYDHLSCGHVAMRQWPEKTNYCPKCGAKVVE